ESDPGAGAVSGLTGDDTPAPSGEPAPAQLSGQVRITAWQPLGEGSWRLVFTAPASALKGNAANLVPDRSFSVKYATQLDLLANGGVPGAGESSGSLAFTIDAASAQNGTLTVTLTVPDVSQTAPRSLFVRIADPSAN
ncbi:MAG: hypothetical protein IJ658_05170, partial [Kiritimatiellae bacterium]|nr:hypothetical protein [Kiritimatiellia bacterium]